MRAKELRAALQARGLDARGRKAVLIARLTEADAPVPAEAEPKVDGKDASAPVIETVARAGRSSVQHARRKRARAAAELAQRPTGVTAFEVDADEPTLRCKRVRTERMRASGATIDAFDVWGAAAASAAAAPRSAKASRRADPLPRKRAPAQPKTAAMKALPAVQLPEAGESYNPSFEDHQQSIARAVEKEARLAAAREREQLKRGAFGVSQNVMVDDEAWTSSEDEDEPEAGSEQANKDGASASGFVRQPRKKTRAQRNKQKRHRAEQRRVFQLRQQKKMLHEAANCAKQFQREHEAKEAELSARREEKRAQIEARSLDPEFVLPKVGARTQKDFLPRPAMALSEELHGSLRKIQSQSGTLMADRMMSLLRRGTFEIGDKGTRRKLNRQKRRARRVVGTERWGLGIYGKQHY
jgi:hypothetical protein